MSEWMQIIVYVVHLPVSLQCLVIIIIIIIIIIIFFSVSLLVMDGGRFRLETRLV